MKTKLMILTMILAFASLYAADTLYSGMDDKSDRLSNDQAGVFSPGYINAATQKTREIINQANQYKSSTENTTERVKDKLSDNVMEDSANKVTPELKKKTGAAGEGSVEVVNTSSVETTVNVMDSTQYNVGIGNGKNKEYDNTGRLIAEVINNTRHVYVGFSNIGTNTIQDAMNMARKGDIVLVRGGNYSGYIDVKDGVSVYGGYNDLGERDIAKNRTTIYIGGFRAYNVKDDTEINGFTIQNPYSNSATGFYIGVYTYNSSEKLRILNNTISSGSMGIYALNSKAIVYGNRIFGQAGAGIYTSGSSLTVTNNIIANAAFGVTENFYSSSLFRNNSVGSNYASFIVAGGSTSTIDKNTIYGRSDGVRYIGSSPTITNNIFSYLPQLFRVSDSTATVASKIITDGNVFFGCTSLGVSASVLSQGSNKNNVLVDPSQGYYTSVLFDKGYSTSNVTVDYNKIAVRNSIDQSFSSSISGNSGVLTIKDNRNLLMDGKFKISDVSSPVYLELSSTDNRPLGDALKSVLMNKGKVMGAAAVGVERSSLPNNGAVEFVPMVPGGILKEEPARGTILTFMSILNNPTEDQKLLLDAAQSIMNESASPELKKSTDDLLQMVASVLIAQAIPDLLKEGDVSNIKNIFAELGDMKGRIMLEYQESTKPYYDQMVKELSKNMSLLQLKNILSGSMTKEELAKIPPNELAKIMEKLSQAKDKSFEEEYMLQQEAKYRKTYIDPNKKILDEKMKNMLEGFTRRLSGVLETTKAQKK